MLTLLFLGAFGMVFSLASSAGLPPSQPTSRVTTAVTRQVGREVRPAPGGNPFTRLFPARQIRVPPQPGPKVLIMERATTGMGRTRIVCGTTIIEGNPEIDPGMRLVPRGGTTPAVRLYPPPQCGR